MHKRWYDIDPTISLSVSLIRNSNQETQVRCADYIIDKAKAFGVQNDDGGLNNAFDYILKRWYDKDKRIQESFEYFKSAPFETQKEIALEIINFLQFSELY